MDPITAILSGQWATVTGWTLWIGTLAVLFSFFLTDRIWSGKRGRAVQTQLDKALDTTRELVVQNTTLLQNNELTKYWFENTLPARAKPPATKVGDTDGGQP